ncbi:hypothetical protein D9M72_573750 [compost metagenome]
MTGKTASRLMPVRPSCPPSLPSAIETKSRRGITRKLANGNRCQGMKKHSARIRTCVARNAMKRGFPSVPGKNNSIRTAVSAAVMDSGI